MERSVFEWLGRELLTGALQLDQFVEQLAAGRSLPLGEVTLDLDRARRCGFPEVIYADGKSPETIIATVQHLRAAGQPVLATRLDTDKAGQVLAAYPDGIYNPVGRTFRMPHPKADGLATEARVTLVTAGTSDLPVAEEARETLAWMGIQPQIVKDVGVAGPHRLRERLDQLLEADCVIVIAGMEGALPSVVGGYVDCPVVAVPTSVGYGASFGGLAALLGMLNSCASNVTVVNIDAGFKGAYVAGMIARRVIRRAAAAARPTAQEG